MFKILNLYPTDALNKLQCLFLESLVYCLWVRPSLYPVVEHLTSASHRLAAALLTNTSLLRTSVNYGQKRFNNIAPYYKANCRQKKPSLSLITVQQHLPLHGKVITAIAVIFAINSYRPVH
jgi:hypothetical protein